MNKTKAPFLLDSMSYELMSLITMGMILVPGVLYGIFFDPTYLYKIPSVLLIAWGFEFLFNLINVRIERPTYTTGITALLLFLSVPPMIPIKPLCIALFISVFLVKLIANKNLPLQLNAMLIGRLFLMMYYPNTLLTWGNGAEVVDALTASTPLTIFSEQGFFYPPLKMFLSTFNFPFLNEYHVTSPAPADAFGAVNLIIFFTLWRLKVIDIRLPIFFIFTFILLNWLLNSVPPLFTLFSGSLIFSSIYIAGSPRHTPASKGGKIFGGVLAGLLHFIYRKTLFYPETIVFTFLSINLLTPIIDRFALYARSFYLSRSERKLRGSVPSL